MSRFADNSTALECDLAMQYYRATEKRDEGYDPADWIEALHFEHWQTLDELRKAREESQDERLAKLKADVQLALRTVQVVQTTLGDTLTSLHYVLDDTPAVCALRAAGGDLRRAMRALEESVA